MSDHFNPGPLFRRAVDQRTRRLRRRHRYLYGGSAVAVVAAAIAVPLAVSAGTSRTSVKIIAPPPATTASPTTTPITSTPTTTAPATTALPPGPAPCSEGTGPYGTVSVCPGSAPVGSTVTISASSGCQNLVSLDFLGPLAYIGSSGGGDQVPGNPAGGHFTIRYVIPASYGSGGNVQEQIPVGPGSDYQISSYPAGECSAPLTITGPAGTEQISFEPYTPAGQLDPALRVTGNPSGTCNTYLGAAGDQLYARCFSTTGPILDPCFVNPSKGEVPSAPLACPGDPRGGEVALFTATSFTSDQARHLQVIEPWAMQLADGQLCRFVSAAWGASGPYDCQGSGTDTPGMSPVADCRVPQPSAPWWTTTCQPSLSDSSPFSPTTVAKVWF